MLDLPRGKIASLLCSVLLSVITLRITIRAMLRTTIAVLVRIDHVASTQLLRTKLNRITIVLRLRYGGVFLLPIVALHSWPVFMPGHQSLSAALHVTEVASDRPVYAVCVVQFFA